MVKMPTLSDEVVVKQGGGGGTGHSRCHPQEGDILLPELPFGNLLPAPGPVTLTSPTI